MQLSRAYTKHPFIIGRSVLRQTDLNLVQVVQAIHKYVRITYAGIRGVYGLTNKTHTQYYMPLFPYSSQGSSLRIIAWFTDHKLFVAFYLGMEVNG